MAMLMMMIIIRMNTSGFLISEPDLGAGGQRCIGFEVSSRQLPLFNIKGHIF